jgi:hypothetical protein
MNTTGAQMTTKDAYCFKVLDISTVHMAWNDNKLLENNSLESPVSFYSFEYGYFVYVGMEKLTENDRNAYRAFGLSEAFIHVLEVGRAKGCKFVCFDCDGMVYDDLPKFDW